MPPLENEVPEITKIKKTKKSTKRFILIALSYLWYKTETKQKLARLGYNFIVAGALGNLIDRIRLGHVIDFISFYVTDLFHFAIFNVADSFITIGAIIIILEEILLFLNKRKYLTNQE